VPIIVVATQCIEAGADFDFDSLVTECASLDALRQRFGRLNRLGAITDARGVVLVRSDAIGSDRPDVVYGEALGRTWDWISAAPRDFGVDAMNAAIPNGAALGAMLPAASRAPVMLPAHLDAWSQTSPAPRPDPDVSLWLHGVDVRPEADVQIVWRADVSAEFIAATERREDMDADEGTGRENALAALLARMDVCPPTGLEAIAVPIGAARAWLAGAPAFDVADIEGLRRFRDEEETRRPITDTGRCALLWKGEDSVVVRAGDLRPGMTLVVPSSYGGLAHGTWDPSSQETVVDLGDRARWKQTRRPTLRLLPTLIEGLLNSASAGQTPLLNVEDSADDDRERVTEWLASLEPISMPEWLSEVVRALRASKRRPPAIVRVQGSGLHAAETVPGYLAVVGRSRVREDGNDVSTEDDGASHTGTEVTLRDHMEGVKTWAGRFATHCGLPHGLVRDLEIAARWHDAGKVDPRFQRLLRGGSPLADVEPEPLGKSKIVAADRATRVRARERSGYPKGARHELSSVSLIQNQTALLANATDQDLVLHLVASHHGWCRPFAPVVEDREPVRLTLEVDGTQVCVSSDHGLAALDSGIGDRFWRVVERYGWFGVAWLEAILRLADHRRSEEEQTLPIVAKEST
jgi:CRISPR-associated endonuclease/helicase Cas3